MTADTDTPTYDLTLRFLNPSDPEASSTLYRDLTAGQLAEKLSEHHVTLPPDVEKGSVTIRGGVQLLWEPVIQAPPATPLEQLQALVAFLKQRKLQIRTAGLTRIMLVTDGYDFGFDVSLDYDSTLSDLLAAADHLRDARMDVVQWDTEGSARRAMRLELRGMLVGLPIEIGYAVSTYNHRDAALVDYLRANVPDLAEVTDHRYLTVPLDIVRAAANAAAAVES